MTLLREVVREPRVAAALPSSTQGFQGCQLSPCHQQERRSTPPSTRSLSGHPPVPFAYTPSLSPYPPPSATPRTQHAGSLPARRAQCVRWPRWATRTQLEDLASFPRSLTVPYFPQRKVWFFPSAVLRPKHSCEALPVHEILHFVTQVMHKGCFRGLEGIRRKGRQGPGVRALEICVSRALPLPRGTRGSQGVGEARQEAGLRGVSESQGDYPGKNG